MVIKYDGSQTRWFPHVGRVEFQCFLPPKIRFSDGTLLPTLQLWDWLLCCWEGVGRFGGCGPFNHQAGPPIVAQKCLFLFHEKTRKAWLARWVAVSNVFKISPSNISGNREASPIFSTRMVQPSPARGQIILIQWIGFQQFHVSFRGVVCWDLCWKGRRS